MKFFEVCYNIIKVMVGVNNFIIVFYCNMVWRIKYLEKNIVGLILYRGYLQKDVQSKIVKIWLKFLDVCYFEGRLQYVGKN